MDAKAPPSKPFVFPVMKKAIEDLFAKPRITKEDIEAFQDRYWEQLVPNFSQALKLLDIHNVPRHHILWAINDRLLEAIRTNIELKSESADQKKCQKLWQKFIKTGMVYIHHPYMRALIMQVLGKMHSIKERHVNLIVDNTYLYDDAPLPVLRHIWIAHPHKFHEELDKVVVRFQNSWSDALLDALSLSITSTASTTSGLVPLLYWPPRRRRRDGAIVRFVEMIGDGQTLYDKVVHILREESARLELTASKQSTGFPSLREGSREPNTPPAKRRRRLNSSEDSPDERLRNSEFSSTTAPSLIPAAFLANQSAVTCALLSTIRFDILMSLNEAKVDRLCVPDRIHRLVWCLDACVRNHRIDRRHASGLAYHVKVQRQRAKRFDLEEQSREWDVEGTSKRSGNHGRIKSSGKSSHGSSLRHNSKRSEPGGSQLDGNSDSDHTDPITESQLLERDIRMICRDPWVLYTLCTSLIRYTLNGLYEYKLPRDISEISLLVHLLIQGVGDDFQHLLSPTVMRDRSGSRLVIQQSEDVNDEQDVLTNPSKSLIGYILPAVAQLQVLAWRAQVAEEILASNNQLCSTPTTPGSTGLLSPVAGSATIGTTRRYSLGTTTDFRNSDQSSSALQKQINSATQSTSVTIPLDYFVHPIGFLILQYHALFALERGELAVLRALLKAAANAVLRAGRPSNKTTPLKAGPTSPTRTTVLSPSVVPLAQLGFRWRPEVLQALILGIARLPPSAPAFVDSSHTASRSVDNGSSSNLDSSDGGISVPEKVHLEQTVSKAISGSADESPGANTGSMKPCLSMGFIEPRASAAVLITRVELAMLLKSSLTLTTDVQLLALAQIAALLPSQNNPGVGTSGSMNTLLCSTDNGSSEPTLLSPITTERERLTTLLSRHVSSTLNVPDSHSENTDSIPSDMSNPISGLYKSSDARVLLALESLKKEADKNSSSSLPLTPASSTGSKLINTATNQFVAPIPIGTQGRPAISQSTHQLDLSWPGNTPRSPGIFAGKVARISHSSSSGSHRFETKKFPGASGSSFYSPSVLSSQVPMATPLTNPGLVGATPNWNNLSGGQSGILQTPRRPSTPPLEFRPSSPVRGNLGMTQTGSRSGPSTQSFNADFTSSACPSPPINRPTNNSRVTSTTVHEYGKPRSPSPSEK